MLRHLLLAALVLPAALAAGPGCAQSGDPDVAATVEGTPITVDELSERYARFVLQAGLPGDDEAVRRDVLTSLINRQLLVRAARDAGIAETPEYAAEEAVLRKRTLLDLYTQRALFDTLTVPDGDVRELFARANTEITARHLYAPTRAEAEALRARLLVGETFESLAREVFADRTLAENGGAVGTFSFDDMDPAFETAAFRLAVGEISEPVRTATGYSVIRVDDRFTKPILTETEFAAKREQFERYAHRRARTEAQFRHSRAVLDDADVDFDEATFDDLSAAASGPVPSASPLEAPLQSRPLVTFGEGRRTTWTVGDIEDLTRTATERQLRAIDSAAALREFIEGLVVRETMLARARALGLDDAPEYARALADALDAYVFEQEKARLRATVRIPDDTLHAHFAAFGEGYRTPERVAVGEILVASRDEANDLQRRLDAGADFGALARVYTLRPGARAASGDLGLVARDELGILAGPVFAAAPGDVIGPLAVADRWALVRVGEREAPRPMSFDEARPRLEEVLERPLTQAHLEAHLARLRARYRVTINEDALARVRLFSRS